MNRSVMAVGALLALTASVQVPPGNDRLAWVDRNGRVLDVIGQRHASLLYLALSPDESQIALRGQDAPKASPHVWIVDVSRGTTRRLTSDTANEGQPAWSPKGDRIAYLSYRNGLGDIFVRATAGGGQDQQLTFSADLHDFAPSWSPDGKHIVFHTQDPKSGDRNVMYLELGSDRTPRPIAASPAHEGLASFSPDGRYVAYSSNESGKWDVHVESFPKGKGRWQLSTNGGIWPKWSGRGDELFYFEGGALMATPVEVTPTFKAGKPQKLFTAEQVGMNPTAINGFNPTYDVARDAQKFLIVQTTKE